MPPRARLVGAIGLFVGLALLTGLIAWQGVTVLLSALATAGFGLVAVALYHLLPLSLDALGWQCLLPVANRPPLRRTLRARWIGESINTLLPVVQIGGPVVRTRLLMQAGVPSVIAAASVVVDVTLIILPQILFTILGLVVLVFVLGGRDLLLPASLGTILMATSLGGFIALQRRGLFSLIARPLQRFASSGGLAEFATSADKLDAQVRQLYGERTGLRNAIACHLLSWLAGTGEVWLALYFLGHPVSLPAAMLLESLTQAVRAAAFVVPGALGVQEGALVLIGGSLGLPPETALALSLSKRCRELLLGVPGLVAWQLGEARGMVDSSSRSRQPERRP